MVKPCNITAAILAIIGGGSIAMMAIAHHLPLSPELKWPMHLGANMGVLHVLLGLVAFLFLEKLGVFARLTMALCLFGNILFTIPIGLMGFGKLAHTPTAPFGGTLFMLAWVVLAIGILISKEKAK